MKTPHPPMITWVAGKLKIVDCDCHLCTRRDPGLGAALVLVVAACTASLVLWLVQ